MLFHSWIFGAFFIVAYAGYLSLRSTRYWPHWLLLASYVFYGWWSPLYLLLILYSTLLDYIAGLLLVRSRRKAIWLAVSIVNNVLLLGFFKYGQFAADNLTGLLHEIGLSLTLHYPQGVLLPVGISFYTFQSMSYTIDLYRGRIPRENNFIHFAAFVSLFPQLVAGPIERASTLLPQLHRRPAITLTDVSHGMSLFVVGLFKKVALADFLSRYVDNVYTDPSGFEAPALIMATYLFAWQIYFDFSGYTDMACGCARMMGIRLTVNFNRPYLATGLGDFWRRWHISLSRWFSDYVYVPMGGNRINGWRTYGNMIATMLLAGLWHGAAWNFVVWGAINALGRSLTRRLEMTRFYINRVPTVIKQICVFHFMCLTWIFFRASSLDHALTILGRIFSSGLADPQVPLLAIAACALVWLFQRGRESRFHRWLEIGVVKIAATTVMLIYLIVFTTSGYEPFIYFQF